MTRDELEYLKNQLKRHEEMIRITIRDDTFMAHHHIGAVVILRQIIRKFN